jgi:hypothetical protein
LSKDVLQAFDDFLANYNTISAYSKLQHFLEVWRTYYSLFQAWKSKDTGHLMNDLMSHYLDLERLWNSVQNSPGADVEWKPYVTEYQAQVRTKIHNIGGNDAVEKLEARLAALRQSHSEQPHTMEERDSSSAHSKAPQVHKEQPDSVSAQSKKVVDIVDAVHNPSPQVTPKNPNLSSTLEQDSHFTDALTNMQLAHELVMDPDFKIAAPEKSETEKRIKEIAQKAFLDHIGEQIAQNVYHTWFPSLVQELRDGLLQMLSPQGAMHKNISDVIDIERIAQECAHGKVDVMGYAQFIIGKMKDMCAPVRDGAIRKLVEEQDIGKVLTGLHDLLSQMHVDLANFKLATIKPKLMQEAASYEQAKFDDLLKQGAIDLSRTTAWLQNAVDVVSDKPSHKTVMGEEPRVKYEEVYNEALLSTVMSSTSVTPDALPETFRLDGKRLFDIQNELQRVTLVAVLVLLTKNSVSQRHREDLDFPFLKQQLYMMLDPTNPTGSLADIQTAITCFLKERTQLANTDPSALERLSSLVEKCVSAQFPLYSLVSRRVSACIRHQLATGTFKKDHFTNQGLDMVEAELEKVSTKLCLLAKHNKEVHAKHYDEIIRQRLAQN